MINRFSLHSIKKFFSTTLFVQNKFTLKRKVFIFRFINVYSNFIMFFYLCVKKYFFLNGPIV
ncbi:hypothetical protein LEP1GSC072_2460 [Leptospira noguchii str. Bonito]|nr:hypothetical protein LEP1GSC072_2460 [Leptospira noguchii str. Bonito]